MAYWIFLALFYLLSSMMKKKKQQTKLKKTGEEEKTNGLFSQTDELFKFLKLDGMATEKSDQIVESELDEELLFYGDDPSPPLDIIDREWKDESDADFFDSAPLREKELKSNIKKYHRLEVGKLSRLFERSPESVVNKIKKEHLGSPNNLRSAVLLKEILDKPKALRKTAR